MKRRKYKRHGLPYRRAREGKTDYKVRLRLLSSNKIRLVARKTSKNIYAQFVEYHDDGDKVISSSSSADLVKNFGWKGAYRNTPAAYLVGLSAGLKAKSSKLKEAIFDIGLQRSVKGSVLYALLKGAKDSGLNIPGGEDMFPSQERIEGKHLKNSQFSTVKSSILKKFSVQGETGKK